ncbi:expressed unknown protein [Seminavis robusta]|uniref:Uncharacterized protein n=1 Tax=Seminavis robusta TaxID=568900 RepID=A0A9N8DDM6_9STRA|nr:expressed unknown protein [Seminavis robusta]|eukprot:Sro75_g041030.1 n/a (1243) ;mRNA; f:23478-27206
MDDQEDEAFVVPTKNDVIRWKQHPGTKFYIDLLERHAKKLPPQGSVHHEGQMNEKAKQIVRTVTMCKGRFLKSVEGNRYRVMNDNEALQKAVRGLRNKQKAMLGGGASVVVGHRMETTKSDLKQAPKKDPDGAHFARDASTTEESFAVQKNPPPPKKPAAKPPRVDTSGEDKVIPFFPSDRDVISTVNVHYILNHKGTVAYGNLLEKFSLKLPPTGHVDFQARLEEFSQKIVDTVTKRGRFLKIEGEMNPSHCILMDRKSALLKVKYGLQSKQKRQLETKKPPATESTARGSRDRGATSNEGSKRTRRGERTADSQPSHETVASEAKTSAKMEAELKRLAATMGTVIPFEPTDYDVVSTRNRHWLLNHKGTIAYGKLIEEYCAELPPSNHHPDFSARISEVANTVVDQIMEKGRFLRIIEGFQNPTHCLELNRQAALRKVDIGFRNKIARNPKLNRKFASSEKTTRRATRLEESEKAVTSNTLEESPPATAKESSTDSLELPRKVSARKTLTPSKPARPTVEEKPATEGEKETLTMIPFEPTDTDVISSRNTQWNEEHKGTTAYLQLLDLFSPQLPPHGDEDFASRLREFAITIYNQITIEQRGRFLKIDDNGVKQATFCYIMDRESCLAKVELGLRKKHKNTEKEESEEPSLNDSMAAMALQGMSVDTRDSDTAEDSQPPEDSEPPEESEPPEAPARAGRVPIAEREGVFPFVPTDRDVIASQCPKWNHQHEGATAYSKLIDQYVLKLPKMGSQNFISTLKDFCGAIYDHITLERKGRFLKLANDGLNPTHCYIMSREACMYKIEHGLRKRYKKRDVVQKRVKESMMLEAGVPPERAPEMAEDTQENEVPATRSGQNPVAEPGAVIPFVPTDRDVISSQYTRWNIQHNGAIAYSKLLQEYAAKLPKLSDDKFNSHLKDYANAIYKIITEERQGRFLRLVDDGINATCCYVMDRESIQGKVEHGLRNRQKRLQKHATSAGHTELVDPKPQDLPPRPRTVAATTAAASKNVTIPPKASKSKPSDFYSFPSYVKDTRHPERDILAFVGLSNPIKSCCRNKWCDASRNRLASVKDRDQLVRLVVAFHCEEHDESEEDSWLSQWQVSEDQHELELGELGAKFIVCKTGLSKLFGLDYEDGLTLRRASEAEESSQDEESVVEVRASSRSSIKRRRGFSNEPDGSQDLHYAQIYQHNTRKRSRDAPIIVQTYADYPDSVVYSCGMVSLPQRALIAARRKNRVLRRKVR